MWSPICDLVELSTEREYREYIQNPQTASSDSYVNNSDKKLDRLFSLDYGRLLNEFFFLPTIRIDFKEGCRLEVCIFDCYISILL